MNVTRTDWRGFLVIGCATSMLWGLSSCAHAEPAPAADAGSPGQAVDPATKQLMAANGLFQRGLFKLAGQQYADFLRDNPQNPQATAARYGLAVCDYRLDDYEPAVDLLTRVLADDKFEQKDEALAVLGYCELATRRYDKAITHFDQLVQKYPTSKQADSAATYSAQAHYLAGQYPLSAAACEAFLAKHAQSPERSTALYFLSLSRRALGQNDQALASLNQLQKDYPDSRYATDARLVSGQALEASGKLDEAIEQYRKLLAAAPQERKGDAHYSLGLALYKAGKMDEAGRELNAVVRDFPTSTYAKSARLQLGLVQLAAGNIADARGTLEAVVKDDPARASEARYGLAQCDMAEKKFEPARATFDALARLQPPPANLSQILLYRAVCLMELSKLEQAAAEFESVATQFPKSAQAADALYREAFCFHKLAQYDKSHAVCQRVSGAAPETTAAVARLDAENLYLLARYADAETAFVKLAADTKDPQRQLFLKLRIGQCEYFAGNYDRAVELLQPVANDPQSVQSQELQQAAFLLGDAQLQRGKNAEAITALKDFISRGKGDLAEAQYKLSVAQIRAGDAAGAEATLDALTQAPDTNSTWVQRGLFELGQLRYKAQKLDPAGVALDRLMAANPPPELGAPAAYLMGWVRYDAKKFVEAAAMWKRVLDKYPNDKLAPDAAFQQGVALKEAGKSDEAVAALQAFASAHNDSPNADKARRLAASILTSQGRNADAEKLLTELAKDPKASEAVLYDLAWAQKQTSQPAAAENTYRRLLKDHPDSPLLPAVKTELAELLFTDKKYADATALLEAVLADKNADPKIASAAEYRLGWCYQKMGQPGKAADLLAAFAAHHPEDPLAGSALLQAGLAQADDGKFDAAEKSLADMIKRFPGSKDAPIAMLRLAEVQASQSNFDQSLQTSNDFLSKYAKDPLAYRAQFSVGWALENLKKYDEARAAYLKVTNLTNTETAARAQFQTGETFLAQQKFEQAIPALLAVEDVYAYPKWSARALLEAGRAFEQIKQPDQARQQYTQLLAKYKDAPEAGAAQDRLQTIKGS